MTDTINKHFTFVYGTLMGMEKRFHGVKKLGRAVTTDAFVLFNGGYPLAITPEDPEARDKTNYHGRVIGEAYEVDAITMEDLDDYEGTNPANDEKSFYYRKPVTVRLDDGVEIEAWMYLGGTSKASIPQRDPILPNELGEVSWR
jgi:gamma-glutamylcyclotransferase (GGCT)/AIG2-like uncharacterized protein YtfP